MPLSAAEPRAMLTHAGSLLKHEKKSCVGAGVELFLRFRCFFTPGKMYAVVDGWPEWHSSRGEPPSFFSEDAMPFSAAEPYAM